MQSELRVKAKMGESFHPGASAWAQPSRARTKMETWEYAEKAARGNMRSRKPERNGRVWKIRLKKCRRRM